MSLSKAYYNSNFYEPPATASGPNSRAVNIQHLNNNLNIQASVPKVEYNISVPLANRKPEHFCDLTICNDVKAHHFYYR